MKTIKISLIILAMLLIGAASTNSSFAGKPPPRKTMDVSQLNKIMRQTVKFPDFDLTDNELDATTRVIFTLTWDGKINILNVSGPSERLEKYVRDKLSTVKAGDINHFDDQRYGVKIRFKDY